MCERQNGSCRRAAGGAGMREENGSGGRAAGSAGPRARQRVVRHVAVARCVMEAAARTGRMHDE
eukprot:2789768-Prymnesium_polylepis.1